MEQKELDDRLTTPEVIAAADALSNALKADVIFFSGDLTFWTSREIVGLCRKRKNQSPNVVIVLCTDGGSADAAYRIARHLQGKYTEVLAFVPGQCKSAGTLIASGAHKIYIGDFGELGPLDIQQTKKDELWEASSGLNVDEAIRVLEKTAEKMFFDYVQRIKRRSRSVTYKTAAQLSIELIGKLLGPIMAQINPDEIGENSRAMDITKNYAARLDKKSDNFKRNDSIDFLVGALPDHGFVIDRKEAKEIFREVHEPTPEMLKLEEALGKLSHDPIDWDASGVAWEARFLSAEPTVVVAAPISVSAATVAATGPAPAPAANTTVATPAEPQSHLTVVGSDESLGVKS
jgi:hypothetical protein